jgi:hypothetical protein
LAIHKQTIIVCPAPNSGFAQVAVWFPKESFVYIWESVFQRSLVQGCRHLRKCREPFETTGIISLESLLKISEALKRLTDFESLLLQNDMERKKNLFDY